MSLLIHKPEGEILPESEVIFQKFATYGKDSFGLAFAKDGKLHIQKNFTNLDNFLEVFESVKKCSCLLHFADKPYDEKEKNNYCGPYRLDENFVVGHVGKVWSFNTPLQKPGFCQSINLLILLKQIFTPAAFGQEYLKYLVEKAVPGENKIAILKNTGEIQIFNHSTHTENSFYKNLWFSSYVYLGQPTYSAASSKYSYPNRQINTPPPGYVNDFYIKNTGVICNICKNKIHTKTCISFDHGLGVWICFQCEKENKEIDKICHLDNFGKEITNPVSVPSENPEVVPEKKIYSLSKKEKISFVKDLKIPEPSFLDVFQVI